MNVVLDTNVVVSAIFWPGESRQCETLSCALACGAKIITSKDRDLLVLGKPFGIEILTPRQFLSRLEQD